MSLNALAAELQQAIASLQLPDEHPSRRLAAAGASAALRGHFTPGHFTVSALVLSPDDRKVVLLHHRKLQRWLQPGGHIEPEDPTLVGGAIREVEEETGLHLTDAHLLHRTAIDIDVHVIPARKDEPAHEHHDLRFAFRAPSDEIAHGEESLGIRWVDIDTLLAQGPAGPLHPDASILRSIGRLRPLLADS